MKQILSMMIAAGLLTGCSSVSVQLDYDASTDFNALKSYAWKHADQPAVGDPRIDNDLNDKRIRAAVDSVLAAKGLVPVDQETADVLVAYFVDFKRRLNSSSISFGIGSYGRYGRYGGVGYDTGISDYEEGNLTIDIIDRKSGETIWRGIGSRAVYTGSNPEKATRIIKESVARIMKKFPPGK